MTTENIEMMVEEEEGVYYILKRNLSHTHAKNWKICLEMTQCGVGLN